MAKSHASYKMPELLWQIADQKAEENEHVRILYTRYLENSPAGYVL